MFRIIQAKEEHVDQITQFNMAMAKETENIDLDANIAKAGVTRLIQNPSFGKYYLIVMDSIVCGSLMITYEFSDWRNQLYKWIQSVYIVPEYRNKGAFKTLFSTVVDLEVHQMKHTSQACASLRLYVDEHNVKAKQVYEKLGMKQSHYNMYEMNFFE